MNFKTRLYTVKCWIQLICLVNVLCFTAYADFDEISFIIPFKDQNGSQLCFCITNKKEHSYDCRVDKESQCWVNLRKGKCVFFHSERNIKGFIEQRNMLPMPERFINDDGQEVEVTFLSDIAWDGNYLYVEPECEFEAQHYKPAKMTDADTATNTLRMERKIQYHLTLKLPPGLEEWDLFKRNLKGTAHMKSGNENIPLAYDINTEGLRVTSLIFDIRVIYRKALLQNKRTLYSSRKLRTGRRNKNMLIAFVQLTKVLFL